VSVFVNQGNGTFGAPAKVTTGQGLGGPTSVAIGDLDGDGIADLAVAAYHRVHVRLGTCSP
jgi:hypothetical protein